jgi:HSP20 family protein
MRYSPFAAGGRAFDTLAHELHCIFPARAVSRCQFTKKEVTMFPVRRRMLDPTDFIRREIDRLFGEWTGPEELEGSVLTCPVDLREDDEHLFLEAEIPGFAKEEIELSLEEGVLSIKAERKISEPQGTQHLRERSYTRVQRRLTLPASVDPNDVDARFENGVLHLRMKKSAASRRRRIELH